MSSPASHPLDRLGRAFVRRRGVALALVLAITVLSQLAMGLRVWRDGVPVDFTPQALFIDKGSEIDALREIETTFGREDNDLILIVDGLPPDEAGVAALRQLDETLSQAPIVERVDSPVSSSVLVEDGGALAAITPLEDRPPADALRLLSEAPVTRKLLVSESGRTVALRVRLDGGLERVADLAPQVHAVVDLARSVPLPAGASLHPTGVPYVRTEVTDRMVSDQATFVPLVGLMFGVSIAVLFRRLYLGLAPLVAVAVADMWAMGLLIGGGATLNVLSILVPTLVLVIGVADGIHLTARYREEIDSGKTPEAAMGQTFRSMTLPCFLTTFTTGAGFASLLVADTSVIQAFGVHAAIAMVVCFFGVMSVLPTLLAWIPPDKVPAPATSSAWADRALGGVDKLVSQRPVAALLACLAVAGTFGFVGSGVRPNSHLLEMYREGSPTYTAIKLSERELSGVIPVFFHIDAGEPDAWKDPDLLRRLDELEQTMIAEEHVLWTASLAGYVRELHSILSDGTTALPDSQAAIAQELLVGELAGGAPTSGVLTEDGQQARVMALVADAGGRAFLPMRDRLNEEAKRIFEGTGLSVMLTGDGLLAAVGIHGLITDLLSSLALMFVVILATLSLLLRDLRLAFIACVPNAIPLLFTLGTLGLMGADLQASNVVSFTVAVGLAVDDTIHFIVRFQDEHRQRESLEEAITATFLGAGRPIVLTSMLLVAGFGVLCASDLTSTRHFGLLSSVTMVAALVGDLLFLPALLHLSGLRRRVP